MKRILLILVIACFYSCQLKTRVIKQNPNNWRYFDNGSGKAIFLTGAHTWTRNLSKPGWPDMDWDLNKWQNYIQFLKFWNHNFIRMWMWEHDGGTAPCIWTKTGGKFDLNSLNQAYFDRVKSFVEEAKNNNIYVGVMLFQGWSGAQTDASIPYQTVWGLHPMKLSNNVNSVNGDSNNDGWGEETRDIKNAVIRTYWENYVKKMIDTLNGYDNIIWEIANENHWNPFNNYFIDYIHTYEAGKPKQHMVWYDGGYNTGNSNIWASNADAYGPEALAQWGSHTEPYFLSPPVPTHNKPELLDTDHIGNLDPSFTALEQRNWAWKAFTRGYHVLHMEWYDNTYDAYPGTEWANPTANNPIPGVSSSSHFNPQRKAMGDILRYTSNMKYLANTVPTADINITSTGYCLYYSGKEYIAYQPSTSGSITINFAAGSYDVQTFDTNDSSIENTQIVSWAGGQKTFVKPPHVSEDWVLYIVA